MTQPVFDGIKIKMLSFFLSSFQSASLSLSVSLEHALSTYPLPPSFSLPLLQRSAHVHLLSALGFLFADLRNGVLFFSSVPKMLIPS